jgi:hypothetical protein
MRAAKRMIAPLGQGRVAYGIPASPLTDDDVEAILSELPARHAERFVRHFVIEISRLYLHWVLESERPRSETRYQLRMMAHLAWRVDHCPASRSESRRELAALLRSCNPVALKLICEGVRRQTGEPTAARYVQLHRYATSSATVRAAALEMEREAEGTGDYGRQALKKAMALLAFVYDCASGSPPAFSRVPTGPLAIDGEYRTTSRTPCARFLFAFFRCVDPALSEPQITNALERRLLENRRRQKTDPPYFQDLPNLL